MADPRANKRDFKRPDALIIKKASFLAALQERVQIGKSVFQTSITNYDEYEKNERDYNKWNVYNSELLKQSFNNEQNEYKIRYDRINQNSGFIRGIYGEYGSSTEKQSEYLKDKITNKIDFLERLIDTTSLLKSEVESEEVQLQQKL